MPSTNDFQVILSAEEQTFYINYGYAFTNFGNVPPFPPNAYSQKGLTGAPLAISGLGAAPTGYHYSAVMNNKGHLGLIRQIRKREQLIHLHLIMYRLVWRSQQR